MTEIKIKNNDVNLSGWFWNRKGNKAPLVIFFQGNAQNSSKTMFQYFSSDELQDMLGEYNILIVDYPGYGLSGGKPSDDSMFTASDYIFNTAKNMQEVDPDNIVIMGYSIGTGVATYCASQNDANGLILVAPYDKALSLYNDSIDSFHGPVESLARYSFDSASYAKDVQEPVLIITSKADKVINYQHSLNLSEQFSDLEDVLTLEDVDHNSYFYQAAVVDKIGEFLKNRLN
jgi:pimeloyl-ACP methyl ester carboxylesterase